MRPDSTDWEARARAAEAKVVELEAEVAALRKRPALGRKAKPARTDDQRLIASACKVLVVSRAQLAERLGVDGLPGPQISAPLVVRLGARTSGRKVRRGEGRR